MKKQSAVLLAALLLAENPCDLLAQLTETNNFTGLNKLIPDGNASGLSDLRAVTSAITNMTAVRVRVHIAGEFNGDIYGYVRHIQGGATNLCVLLNRVGRSLTNDAGYDDAGFNITFADSAPNGDIHNYRSATNPPSGSPVIGSWQPDGRTNDPAIVLDTSFRTTVLDSFAGADANGEWTLFLADLESGGTNMLVAWGLEISGQTTPSVTWTNPPDITYGTALSGAELNATASVPGTFVYSPSAGTVLNAGANQVLLLTFTPFDTANYLPVTTNVALNVLQQTLTISVNNTNKVYGAALPEFTAIYSGFVNGDSPDSLTAPVSLVTSASVASDVGIYLITGSGASGSNYSVGFISGTLTVIPAGSAGVVGSSVNPSPPGQSITFTISLSALAPGAGLPTGTVQFKVDGAAAGPPATLSGGAAQYVTSTLALGTHTVLAEYGGDGNFIGTTNRLAPDQLVNTPPIAGPDAIDRDPMNSVKVSVATLLSNDFDPDSDSIIFIGVNTNSASGGTITMEGNWLFYMPNIGFTNADSFTYQVSDARGSAVTGTVTVDVRLDNGPSPNLTITSLANGSYRIHFDGIYGRAYRIQYAEDVDAADWITLGSATADQFGAFEFSDTPPVGALQRFYRSVYP